MPARLRDIARACAYFDLIVERPSSGSHWKVKGDGARTYPVPASNGEKSEISDKYIKALCRNFGIDERAFRDKL